MTDIQPYYIEPSRGSCICITHATLHHELAFIHHVNGVSWKIGASNLKLSASLIMRVLLNFCFFRMDSVATALEEVLSSALPQGCITVGVYEAAKSLNV